MSLPPPPDSFGSQPPTGGGHSGGGGTPQHWAPQQPGGPVGPPPGGPPWGPQQPWSGQQQWPGGPPPPPQDGGGKAKWIIGALAIVLAIALAVVITVVLVRPDSGGNGPANAGSTGADSEFASANDTGPVAIITEDPTCDAWSTIVGSYSRTAKSVNWDDRDVSIPAASWTPEQRTMYETVGSAMTQAADQTVSLVTKTPHRAMRMLYTQFIAYSRAFVERIPAIVGENDDILAGASNGAGSALTNICSAIQARTAQAVAPLVSGIPAPAKLDSPEDPQSPAKLMSEPNAICSEWVAFVVKFDADTKPWREVSKSIPAKDWTPEQRAVNDAVGPIMLASADEMERIGRQSHDPRVEDLTAVAAQYRRGFALAIPDYKPTDIYLELSTTNIARLVTAACKAEL